MSDAQDQYRKDFGLGEPPDFGKAEKALNLALDIRKFEIGLYWQRAAYFWALIAAAFAGYFAILGSEHLEEKEYLAYLVSCIGLIFSWAWFLVNRGSKYWQENWENHVDMLENEIVGPLYKTILHRPEDRPFFEKHVMGPQAISVSQINLLVSIFTLVMWAVLVAHSLPPLHYSWAVSWKHVTVGGCLGVGGNSVDGRTCESDCWFPGIARWRAKSCGISVSKSGSGDQCGSFLCARPVLRGLFPGKCGSANMGAALFIVH